MSLLALALPVLTTLGACSGEQTSNWPALEQERSAHFRYWVRSDDSELCPGITNDLERHRQALLDYLVGTQPDSRPRTAAGSSTLRLAMSPLEQAGRGAD